MPNAKQIARMKQKQAEKVLLFWGELTSKEVWDRHWHKGFFTTPKTMSLIMRIIDDLTKGSPAGNAYFVLWCHTWDNPMVEIQSEQEFAFESGFGGERPVNTWRARMKALQELGFIRAKKIEHDFSVVLIRNPHTVIKELFDSGKIKKAEYYSAIIRRAHEIDAAKDFAV